MFFMEQLHADTDWTRRLLYEPQATKLIFEAREYSDGRFECHNEKPEHL